MRCSRPSGGTCSNPFSSSHAAYLLTCLTPFQYASGTCAVLRFSLYLPCPPPPSPLFRPPQAYDHAYDLIQCFHSLPMGAEVLLQLDRLVTLLETPCFTFLRLQLLQPRRHPALLRAMYSLLMLLPQSNAWRTLNTRMQSIPIFALMQLDGDLPFSASAGGGDGGVFAPPFSAAEAAAAGGGGGAGGFMAAGSFRGPPSSSSQSARGLMVEGLPALLGVFVARQQRLALVEERGGGGGGVQSGGGGTPVVALVAAPAVPSSGGGGAPPIAPPPPPPPAAAAPPATAASSTESAVGVLLGSGSSGGTASSSAGEGGPGVTTKVAVLATMTTAAAVFPVDRRSSDGGGAA